MKKKDLLELMKKCCHHTLFGWTCTSTTGRNAPNRTPLNCRSCQEFKKVI